MIDWGEGGSGAFDHRRTGFRLAGKHASQECRACHHPKFQVSEAAILSPRKTLARSFIGLELDCVSCHADIHRGTAGQVCRTCHDPRSWRPAGVFQHATTAFPLTGRHADVACDKCHRTPVAASGNGSETLPVTFSPLRHDECSDCHQDPHERRLGANCSSCHDDESFHQVKARSFDHARTRYPLEGRHLQVTCEACHRDPLPRAASGGVGKDGFLLLPPHELCKDCHRDAHGGQLAARPGAGECGSCHRVQGWRPSTISVDDHARFDLALDGRHADIECDACHIRNGERPPAGASPESLGSARVALATLEASCASCHVEPHEGRFSKGGAREKEESCRACHDTRRFRPSLIDAEVHGRFGQPIEGAHLKLGCERCHKELSQRPERSSLLSAGLTVSALPFDGKRPGCRPCHEDPHRDQFSRRHDGGACEGCHDQGRFRPAVRFDHSRTRFPLLRSHSRLACDRCHDPETDELGRPATLYQPLSLDCDACHLVKAVTRGVRRPASAEPGALDSTSLRR